jgi:hypothetical protein
MDHDRYPWEMLKDRPEVTWPGGAKVAVWINVSLPYYPLDQSSDPFPPPHGMKTVYPDLRHYSLREYGHRVGVFRFFGICSCSIIHRFFGIYRVIGRASRHSDSKHQDYYQNKTDLLYLLHFISLWFI